MKNDTVAVRNTKKLSLKRSVRIFEDPENPGVGKRAKCIAEGKPLQGPENVRRVLKDINNTHQLAVKNSNSRKLSVVKEKEVKGLNGKVRKPLETIASEDATEKAIVAPVATEVAKATKDPELDSETSLKETGGCREKTDPNHRVYWMPNYKIDIYSYLYAIEDNYEIPMNHLNGQVLNGLMRAVLVDWLANVVDHLGLTQETLHLTTYILDKFMSIDKETDKTTAQLVALGAVFIASKFEETENIQIEEITELCDQRWSENDLKNIEIKILQTIDYNLGKPLAIHYIRRFSKDGSASPMEHCYAKYFADTALLSYQLCSVKPSIIAAASIFLGICISRDKTEPTLWNKSLEDSSNYKLEDFQPILRPMAQTVITAVTNGMESIHSRYSNPQLFCVSLMPGCRPKTGIINHFCLD